MKEASAGRKNAWMRHGVGLAVSVGCLALVFSRIDLQGLRDHLAAFQWGYLVPAVLGLAAGYAVRVERWSVLLRAAGMRAGFQNCAAPFLGSIALNNVLPLRLGDVVRAFLFPQAMGMSKSVVASSLVMERLTDLMTLLACLAGGLYAVQAFGIPESLRQTALIVGAFGGVMLMLLFVFSGRLGRSIATRCGRAAEGLPKRMLTTVARLLRSFEAMSRPRVLLLMLLMSVLVWAGEATLFYFVLRGFGVDATPAVALLTMSLATLSTLAPSSPGYIGPFHLAAFTALSLAGLGAATAGSYAIVAHLLLWAPPRLPEPSPFCCVPSFSALPGQVGA
jgi:glycosyltransferase 2 family protein